MRVHPSIAAAGIALAFAFGFVSARATAPAGAAGAPLVAQDIDVLSVPQSAMSGPQRGAYTKVYADEPGGWLALQSGVAPKHFHRDSDEFQYFIAGTGHEWLGDRRVNVKPGTLLLIPKETIHGGIAPTHGTLKWISFKLPPPVPGDVHLVP